MFYVLCFREVPAKYYFMFYVMFYVILGPKRLCLKVYYYLCFTESTVTHRYTFYTVYNVYVFSRYAVYTVYTVYVFCLAQRGCFTACSLLPGTERLFQHRSHRLHRFHTVSTPRVHPSAYPVYTPVHTLYTPCTPR